MRASELQRRKRELLDTIEIPKKKLNENPDMYDQRVRVLRKLKAVEEIESEPNPVRQRRMRFLLDHGIINFSDI